MSVRSAQEFGLDAAAVIVKIVSDHRYVTRIRLFESPPAPLVQDRLNSGKQFEHIIAAGLSLRSRYHLPFWDSALLSCFDCQDPPLDLLKAASYHNPSTTQQRILERRDVSVKVLHKIAAETQNMRLLAISSLVELDDGTRSHIPMLDFHCPASPENLRLVEAVVRQLYTDGGFILESGKSYHFYGRSLLKEKELTTFLARALLFAPIVDERWVAHQLIEMACALRLSRGQDGGMPRVALSLSPSK